MTTAAELREALAWVEKMQPPLFDLPIVVAARTIALPILEADPELVERIAKTMYELQPGLWPAWVDTEYNQRLWRSHAREVLVALWRTNE